MFCFGQQKPRLTTESPFGRDKNHGLYSLAARLGINFKNHYPDMLQQKMFHECEFTRKIKCAIRSKMTCKCDYMTLCLFALRNRRTGKEVYACKYCLKDLVTGYDRMLMNDYDHYRELKNRKTVNGKPTADILKQHRKDMLDIAKDFKIITVDERSLLLDDLCDSERKRELEKAVEFFYLLGNGYEENKKGELIVNNDKKADDEHDKKVDDNIDNILYSD